MKLITQSFNIVSQSGFGLLDIYRHIERCARVCYKSEDRITPHSCVKFVDNLIARDHARPLEFGTVHLQLSEVVFAVLRNKLLALREWNDQWIRYNTEGRTVYATANFRYYLRMKSLLKNSLCLEGYLDPSDNDLYPKRYTVHFILSRGIMDEFRTHVGLSHLAESTRYVNYSKGKFNSELTVVVPSAFNSLDITKRHEYDFLFAQAEETYLKLLSLGAKPQEARDVLPLSIKSELVSCGFKKDWDNFFLRRDSPYAHPMAREIAASLHAKFLANG